MPTLSPIYPLSGTISSGRVVSGTVNRLGSLSGQLGTRGLVEPAVEIFHFTVSPNNRITFTDLTVERITDAIHYGKVVLALLFKQHSSYEEYKGLVLTKYEASGKYYFSSVADGYDYVISTINGGVIWDYAVSRTDGEVLAELNTVNKGSLVSAINEVLYVATESTGLPDGGSYGDILLKRSNARGDAEWVTPADTAEQDNTRPITAAAVYTEIGNINALLATI